MRAADFKTDTSVQDGARAAKKGSGPADNTQEKAPNGMGWPRVGQVRQAAEPAGEDRPAMPSTAAEGDPIARDAARASLARALEGAVLAGRWELADRLAGLLAKAG